jgi:hypothetical protein
MTGVERSPAGRPHGKHCRKKSTAYEKGPITLSDPPGCGCRLGELGLGGRAQSEERHVLHAAGAVLSPMRQYPRLLQPRATIRTPGLGGGLWIGELHARRTDVNGCPAEG